MPLDAPTLTPDRSVDSPPMPRSQRWFGLDWRAHLPWRIGDVVVEHGTAEQAMPFIRDHYAAIFDAAADENRWLREPMTPAKRRFLDECDVFILRDGGRTVGVQISEPTDWSTYYIRSTALLPEYQGSALATTLVGRMMLSLREAGVARFDAETTPSNTACIRALIRLGFVPTAMHNTDRWGCMIRLTCFLDEAAEEVFRTQYCAGTWPGAAQKRPLGRKGVER